MLCDLMGDSVSVDLAYPHDPTDMNVGRVVSVDLAEPDSLDRLLSVLSMNEGALLEMAGRHDAPQRD